MFIRLQSGKMLNMRYLQDTFQGFHEKNIVIFYLTNGNKFIEKYETEEEAQDRVSEVRTKMLSSGSGGRRWFRSL